MRLDKMLANSDVGSRKEVSALVRRGLVKINGTVIKKPDTKVTDDDVVEVGDEVISYKKFHYLMLNKPAGVVTSTDDPGATVMDLIDEPYKDKLFPVGRLDKDTTGLLLLTDDGKLAHALLSPARHVDKTYYVETKEVIDESVREAFSKGIDIGPEKNGKHKDTKPAVLEIKGEKSAFITISEGRYHQIKRMFNAVGNEVTYLRRISMGSLVLDESLSEGEYRRLTESEIEGISVS